MIIKNRFFLLFFTLCILPKLQANDTQMFTLEQVNALLAAQKPNSLSFFKIRSINDLGSWAWQSKFGITKTAALVVGICVLKKLFRPEPAPNPDAARYAQLRAEALKSNPALASEFPEPDNSHRNIIGGAMDRIGDFGLSASSLVLNCANRTFWYFAGNRA